MLSALSEALPHCASRCENGTILPLLSIAKSAFVPRMGAIDHRDNALTGINCGVLARHERRPFSGLEAIYRACVVERTVRESSHFSTADFR